MEQLLSLRAEQRLTLRELESRSGVSKDTISDIERGLRKPRPVTLAKLAKALGVEASDLLEDFYSPKDSSLLSAERALRLTQEAFTAEMKTADTARLHKLLAELVGDDVTKTIEDVKAGREDISQKAFTLALEVRRELIERGEKPPEGQLPAFKARLEALYLG